MITPAPTSTETFGLPAEASHLIAKLRAMSPELRNLVMNRTEETTK